MMQKKWVSLTLALSVLSSMCAMPMQASAAGQTLPVQEITDDDFEDIVAINTFLLGISTGTEVIDFNEDGRINAVDLTLAKQELLREPLPALDNFRADTWDIYLEEEKTVTFTVQTVSITEAVMLYDAEGNALAEMHDDGENGDETANDGIFSAQETLSSDTVKNAGFYAAAGEVRSDKFEICFYRDLEEDEFKNFFVLYGKISEMSFEEAVEFISQSDEIASYTIDEEQRQIWYQSIYGIQGCLDDAPETEVPMMGTGSLAVPDANGCDWTTAAANAASATFTPAYPGKKDVIVLRPFYNSGCPYDDFKNAGEILAGALDSNLTVVDDGDVTLEQLKNLDSYGTVLYNSHGVLRDNTVPHLVTGEDLNEMRFLWDPVYYLKHVEYSADYLSGRIFCLSTQYGLDRVAVGGKFFDKYYDADSLTDSFWYLGPCYGMYDDSIADVLIRKGAGAVVGYTHSVSVIYCHCTMFETLINSMVLSGSDVRKGVAEARRIYGTPDPGNSSCELTFKGRRHYKLIDTIGNSTASSNIYTYNGHYYKVVHEKLTWSEAQAYCEAQGGHLATVTSEEEEQFIEQIIGYYNKSDFYWLGGTDKVEEGVWQWVTGEEFTYDKWSASNPNNFNHGKYGYENYLGIVGKKYNFANTFEWNDFADATYDGIADYQTALVCEWE